VASSIFSTLPSRQSTLTLRERFTLAAASRAPFASAVFTALRAISRRSVWLSLMSPS
jgi:hypothetical protein